MNTDDEQKAHGPYMGDDIDSENLEEDTEDEEEETDPLDPEHEPETF